VLKRIFIPCHGGNSQAGCSLKLSVATWIDAIGRCGAGNSNKIINQKHKNSIALLMAFKWLKGLCTSKTGKATN